MQSSIGKPFEGQKGPLKERARCIEEESRPLADGDVGAPQGALLLLHRQEAATGDGKLLLEVVPRCQFCRSIPTCRLLIGWLASALHSHWSRPDSASRSPLDRQWGKCAVVGWWL